MPAHEIRTTLAIDGEKQFKKELKDAGQELRAMGAELKAATAEFKTTGDEMRFFTKRSELLNDEVKQQEEIVKALERAVKEAAKKYGDASSQVNDYRIQLGYATAKMHDLRREAEAADRELEDFSNGTGKFARDLRENVGEAAEEASGKLERMYAKISEDVSAMKSSVAFQTTMDIGEFVMEGIGTVIDFVNENQELNTRIAYARHNLKNKEIQWEEIEDLVARASAVTNNMDGGLEAVSHLAQLEFETKELMGAALNAMLGAYIRTGGALSLESLTEDFRASVTSRVATGTYAEVLEELLKDVSIDEINAALENAANERERVQIALSPLTEGGLQSTLFDFEKEEKELMEANAKRTEISLAWAELAESLQPIVNGLMEAELVVAKGLNKISEGIVDYFTNRFDGERNIGKNMIEWVGERFEWWKEAFIKHKGDFLNMIGINPAGADEQVKEYGVEDADAYWKGFLEKMGESEYRDEYLKAIGRSIPANIAAGIEEAAPDAIAVAMQYLDTMTKLANAYPTPYNIYHNGWSAPNREGPIVPNITLNIDGQRAGELLYDGISEAGGRAVQNKMVVK